MYGGSEALHWPVALCDVSSLHGDPRCLCSSQRHDDATHGLAAHGAQAQGLLRHLLQPRPQWVHLSGQSQGAEGSEVGGSQDDPAGRRSQPMYV